MSSRRHTFVTLSDARQIASETYKVSKLLTESTYKIDKSNKSDKGYKTVILHLSPSDVSGYNVCPKASNGCRSACLNTAGRGRFHVVQKARINKTHFFIKDGPAFYALLEHEIELQENKAKKDDLILAVRLNGTSDLAWEQLHPRLFEEFPDVQFYDYTKVKHRMLKWANEQFPENYHLTFSRSENNDNEVKEVLDAGGNVAVVFANEPPRVYLNHRVVDGDETDLRFLDRPQSVVSLSAKGLAKRDETGFVVHTI